ncbi:MAG: hypothetical protein PHU25_12060 [Deltaproteobacteria bacterium]|nr:hypothetical protein [Deltaproteobacteria bacterium]
MRTTIDVKDEQRAKLLQLAARRGVKGFSALVQEALDEYLERTEDRADRIEAALAAQGALKGKDADELAETCRALRRSWR